MPAIESSMLPLGTPAPAFSLPDVVTGAPVSLANFAASPALLVMFLCRHCPFVVHVQQELARLGRDYAGRAALVAICANDSATYPDDAPAGLKQMAFEQGFSFPLCHDETQAVARAYRAACTPDFFLFDRDRRLVYRGRLDPSRPGSPVPVTGHDVRAALEATLAGQPVDPAQRPSLGCSIKWKT